MRLHQHALVGDGRGNHRILQRGHGDILLPDARHGDGGIVGHRSDGGGSHLERNGVELAVETERLCGFDQLVALELFSAQLGEGGVAGTCERLLQGGGITAAAGGPVVVLQGCVAARQEDRRRRGHLGVDRLAVGQRGGGCDHLEGGPGWVGLRDGAVQHRLRRVFRQPLPGGVLLLRILTGEQVRVVGGSGNHRENLSGGGLQCHHGPAAAVLAAAMHGVIGSLLHIGSDGGHHAAATRVPAGEEVREPAPEEARVGPVEHGVLGAFQSGARVIE
ncbi:Uncharacterised protein [Mycobacteroides abscessus]|nr:Uncharacterised protein [Mycobacteroides abscessus]